MFQLLQITNQELRMVKLFKRHISGCCLCTLWLPILFLGISLVACSSYHTDKILTITPNKTTPTPISINPESATTMSSAPIPTYASTVSIPHQAISSNLNTPTPGAVETANEKNTTVSLPCTIHEPLIIDEFNINLPEKIVFAYQTVPERDTELLSLIHNRDILMLKALFVNNFPQHMVNFETISFAQVSEEHCSDISFIYGGQASHPFINAILESGPISLTENQITVEDRVYQGENLNIAILMPHPFAPKEQIVILTASNEAALNYSFYGYWTHIIQDSFDYIIADGEFPLEKGQIDWTESKVTHYDFGEQQEWRSQKTEHFVFHFRPESLAEAELDSIIEEEENAYMRINNMIGWVDQPIKMYFYNDREDKQQNINSPFPGNGFAYPEFYSVHSVYSSQTKAIGGHETAHVITYHKLGPAYVPMLSEGIAVYLSSPIDSFKPEHEKVASFLQNGDFISLDELIDSYSFGQKEATITYPSSGSFVKFLIEAYGFPRFKQFYQEAQPNNVTAKLEEIYNLSTPELEAAWIATVKDVQESILNPRN
jgi:hypothetical protein